MQKLKTVAHIVGKGESHDGRRERHYQVGCLKGKDHQECREEQVIGNEQVVGDVMDGY